MKNQEYLVKKYNNEGCNYDNRYYTTYKKAWNDTNKKDIMLICKPNTIYFGDNFTGWTVDNENIIREVKR